MTTTPMDPLSAAASVIAVIQLTTTVVQICYQYRCGVKHASKDIVRMTDEVDSLSEVLKKLLPIVEMEEKDVPSRLQTVGLLVKTLRNCEGELDKLKAKLLPKDNSLLRTIGHTLTWPLKEGARLERVQACAQPRVDSRSYVSKAFSLISLPWSLCFISYRLFSLSLRQERRKEF